MASTSSSAAFYARFQELKTTISRDLESGDVSSAARSLTTLKSELRDISSNLPAYDQRSYDLQIRELDNRIAAIRPKTKLKFTFSKPKPQATLRDPETSASSSSAADQRSDSIIGTKNGTDSIRFENRTDERISLEGDVGGSVILSNLTRCIIDFRPSEHDEGSPTSDRGDRVTSIHAEKLEGCILLADVGGSTMLSSITDSLLILSSQQFRMHESSRTVVLLDIPSFPIIEHSNSISFGPNPISGKSKLGDERRSRHAEVQDFGWIKSGPSPNWRLLAPDQLERIDRALRPFSEGAVNTAQQVGDTIHTLLEAARSGSGIGLDDTDA